MTQLKETLASKSSQLPSPVDDSEHVLTLFGQSLYDMDTVYADMRTTFYSIANNDLNGIGTDKDRRRRTNPSGRSEVWRTIIRDRAHRCDGRCFSERMIDGRDSNGTL